MKLPSNITCHISHQSADNGLAMELSAAKLILKAFKYDGYGDVHLHVSHRYIQIGNNFGVLIKPGKFGSYIYYVFKCLTEAALDDVAEASWYKTRSRFTYICDTKHDHPVDSNKIVKQVLATFKYGYGHNGHVKAHIAVPELVEKILSGDKPALNLAKRMAKAGLVVIGSQTDPGSLVGRCCTAKDNAEDALYDIAKELM